VRVQQIGPVPFYRQKPLGGYIVDFHAPDSFTGHLNFPVSCRTSARHPRLGRSAQNGAIQQKKVTEPATLTEPWPWGEGGGRLPRRIFVCRRTPRQSRRKEKRNSDAWKIYCSELHDYLSNSRAIYAAWVSFIRFFAQEKL
jgi:hypothetical protein